MGNSNRLKYYLIGFVILMLQNISVGQTKIDIDSSSVSINQNLLNIPIDSSTLHGILGPSQHEKFVEDELFYWHKEGIFSILSNRTNLITGIGITFSKKEQNANEDGKFKPKLIKTKKCFSGELSIIKTRISSETSLENFVNLGFKQDYFPNSYFILIGQFRIVVHYKNKMLIGAFLEFV